MHHEHFDGSGYPYGLGGDDISVAARILSVAECYDSAISARPHRGAITPEEALQMVRGGSGTRFDPEVAELFATSIPIHYRRAIASPAGNSLRVGMIPRHVNSPNAPTHSK